MAVSKELILFYRVIVMHEDQGLVSHRFRLGFGRIGFGFKKRVLWGWNNDRNELFLGSTTAGIAPTVRMSIGIASSLTNGFPVSMGVCVGINVCLGCGSGWWGFVLVIVMPRFHGEGEESRLASPLLAEAEDVMELMAKMDPSSVGHVGFAARGDARPPVLSDAISCCFSARRC